MVPGDDYILTQLRRGALEFCVLALLQHRRRYGRDLAQQLSEGGVLLSGEGTLYPLLARLRRSGLVQSAWEESTSGPPRRYYTLTDQGTAALAAFSATWKPFREAVDHALGWREGDAA